MFGLSDAILGLTVLAWGNSIGDMIADTSMAKRGAPRVGYSACFGGPLFNLLIGIGLPFTIQILQGGGKTISLGGKPFLSFFLSRKYFSLQQDDLGSVRRTLYQPGVLLCGDARDEVQGN